MADIMNTMLSFTMVCLAIATLADCMRAEKAPSVKVGRTSVYVCAPHIVRVTHIPDGGSSSAPDDRISLVAKEDWANFTEWTKKENLLSVVVETKYIKVVIDKNSELAAFYSKDTLNGVASGKLLLSESASEFTPTTDLGEPTWTIEQQWVSGNQSEALFGGGEFQNGILNFKNAPVQLVQFNTEAIVPQFISTLGYGILWDNYAWSYLNPADPKSALKFKFGTRKNVIGGDSHNGSASFKTTVGGVYHFYIDACPDSYGCGFNKTLHLTLSDGTDVIHVVDWQKLANLPNSMTGRADLKADHTYQVSFMYGGFDGNHHQPSVLVQRPNYGKTTVRSIVGNLIDYYFTYSDGTMDSAIAAYRDITGTAFLYPLWVYGFWQCREHYATQQEVLDAAYGYRNRSIPVDNIVQDWHYWGDLGWGPQWDPKVYPDPKGMVAELRSINFQLMVSVWSKFDQNTSFFKEMASKGQMLQNTTYYDPWNAGAREQFYQYSKKAHFEIGVAALWLDATEPENFPNKNQDTALGSGNALFNTYSLMTTKAITDGLRRDYKNTQGARPFSLTRSSFAGQQRSGAALWSGDTSGAWDSLRRQVTASLNYQMSGMPYWSQDIGGFFRPENQYKSLDYRDLLVRWFQFGVFTPIYRVHGGASHTEAWNYGKDVMKNINTTNNLRYRMLPYTYSGFARVQNEGYTMQRAMVLDYGIEWANVGDQFMWGANVLVAPVVTQADNIARSRNVLLPSGIWYNFWTTESLESSGMTSFKTEAPISASPTFVRSGSILTLGPFKQFTTEKAADPMEIRIYPGNSGSFSLYEDDGFSNSEAFSTIQFEWNEDAQVLNISARKGNFVGMLSTRTFKMVLVGSKGPHHGAGIEICQSPDKVIVYTGSEVEVHF